MITRKSLLLLGNSSTINQLPATVSKRFLTRTAQRPSREKKHYRLWSMPGEFVYRKEVLAKQWNIKWHPGLNVGIDHDKTIYSLCDGVMIITEEKFEPDYSHPLVDWFYKDKAGNECAPLYKRYISVIPKKRISEFKLVDLV